MTPGRLLPLCLAALAAAAAAQESCGSEEVEEMVALQVRTGRSVDAVETVAAVASGLAAPPPPCGYAALLDSSCEAIAGERHDTLLQAKAACAASAECGGVMEDRQSFSLCKAARSRRGVPGSTVLVRAGREECSEKHAALMQHPIRLPTSLLSQPFPTTEPAPVEETTTLEEEAQTTSEPEEETTSEPETVSVTTSPMTGSVTPSPMTFEGYTTLTDTYCFAPFAPEYPDAESAIDACESDEWCAGIFDSSVVTGGYWGHYPGFWMCKAPHHDFGCGSWYQEGIQGTVYWKQNNPNNDECDEAVNEWL